MEKAIIYNDKCVISARDIQLKILLDPDKFKICIIGTDELDKCLEVTVDYSAVYQIMLVDHPNEFNNEEEFNQLHLETIDSKHLVSHAIIKYLNIGISKKDSRKKVLILKCPSQKRSSKMRVNSIGSKTGKKTMLQVRREQSRQQHCVVDAQTAAIESASEKFPQQNESLDQPTLPEAIKTDNEVQRSKDSSITDTSLPYYQKSDFQSVDNEENEIKFINVDSTHQELPVDDETRAEDLHQNMHDSDPTGEITKDASLCEASEENCIPQTNLNADPPYESVESIAKYYPNAIEAGVNDEGKCSESLGCALDIDNSEKYGTVAPVYNLIENSAENFVEPQETADHQYITDHSAKEIVTSATKNINDLTVNLNGCNRAGDCVDERVSKPDSETPYCHKAVDDVSLLSQQNAVTGKGRIKERISELNEACNVEAPVKQLKTQDPPATEAALVPEDNQGTSPSNEIPRTQLEMKKLESSTGKTSIVEKSDDIKSIAVNTGKISTIENDILPTNNVPKFNGDMSSPVERRRASKSKTSTVKKHKAVANATEPTLLEKEIVKKADNSSPVEQRRTSKARNNAELDTVPSVTESTLEKEKVEILGAELKKDLEMEKILPEIKPKKKHPDRRVSATLKNAFYNKKRWLVAKKMIYLLPLIKLEDNYLMKPNDTYLLKEVASRYFKSGKPDFIRSAMQLLEHLTMGANCPDSTDFWKLVASVRFEVFCMEDKWKSLSRFYLMVSNEAIDKAYKSISNLMEPELMKKRITLFYYEGKYEESRKTTVALFSCFPEYSKSFELLMRYSEILFKLDKHEAAINNLEYALLEDIPASITADDITLIIGRCNELRGYSVEAAKTYSIRLKQIDQHGSYDSNKLNQIMWIGIGDICFKNQLYVFAIDFYTSAYLYNSGNGRLRYKLLRNRGLSYKVLGENTLAVQDIQAAHALNFCYKQTSTILKDWSRGYESEVSKLVKLTPSEIILQLREKNESDSAVKIQRIIQNQKRAQKGVNVLQQPVTNNIDDSAPTSVLKEEKLDDENINEDEVVSVENTTDSTALNDETLALDLDVEIPPILVNKRKEALDVLGQLHKAATDVIKKSPLESSLISPEHDRAENRRLQSVYSFRRLGYTVGTTSYLQHWETMLEVALDLFETKSELFRAIVNVKSFSPNISYEEAYCALADCNGNVAEASGKLSDSSYHQEVQNVCSTIDVNSYTNLAKQTKQQTSPVRLKQARLKSIIDKTRQDDDEEEDNSNLLFMEGVPEINAKGKFCLRKQLNSINSTSLPVLTPLKPEEKMRLTKKTISSRGSSRVNGIISTRLAKGQLLSKMEEILTPVDDWGKKNLP